MVHIPCLPSATTWEVPSVIVPLPSKQNGQQHSPPTSGSTTNGDVFKYCKYALSFAMTIIVVPLFILLQHKLTSQNCRYVCSIQFQLYTSLIANTSW